MKECLTFFAIWRLSSPCIILTRHIVFLLSFKNPIANLVIFKKEGEGYHYQKMRFAKKIYIMCRLYNLYVLK